MENNIENGKVEKREGEGLSFEEFLRIVDGVGYQARLEKNTFYLEGLKESVLLNSPYHELKNLYDGQKKKEGYVSKQFAEQIKNARDVA